MLTIPPRPPLAQSTVVLLMPSAVTGLVADAANVAVGCADGSITWCVWLPCVVRHGAGCECCPLVGRCGLSLRWMCVHTGPQVRAQQVGHGIVQRPSQRAEAECARRLAGLHEASRVHDGRRLLD
jgi:hypothetical protein